MFDGIFVFVLAASVALYFGIWAFMSQDFYGNDFLMGTYSPAMNEPVTYLGLLMILVAVYMLEKLTILVTGQLYSLKYNKEQLQAHLLQKNSSKVLEGSRNTTGLGKNGMLYNINNSGGSDESAKDPANLEQARHRSSSVQSKERAYSGYAYNEENYASSALAKAVRRNTQKLIAEGNV